MSQAAPCTYDDSTATTMAVGRRAVATKTPTCQVLGLVVRSTRVGSSDQSSGRKLFLAVMQFRKVAWSPSRKHSVSVSTSLSGRGLPSHGKVLRSSHILAISQIYPGSVPIGHPPPAARPHRGRRRPPPATRPWLPPTPSRVRVCWKDEGRLRANI